VTKRLAELYLENKERQWLEPPFNMMVAFPVPLSALPHHEISRFL